MKFNHINLHQGDVQMFGLSELPKGLKRVEKQFIAASERSGSFHALFGKYDMYETDGGFVIDVKEDCILNHSLKSVLEAHGTDMGAAKVLPKKDHRYTEVRKGIYFTSIQNRFDPLKARREAVKD